MYINSLSISILMILIFYFRINYDLWIKLIVLFSHFSEPNFPDIEGIEKYRGEKLHSHDYREPSAFLAKRVVVLGAGASGLDISLEIAKVADKVRISPG